MKCCIRTMGKRKISQPVPVRYLGAFALLSCLLAQGCASLSNPVGDAIPVRLAPPELLAPSRGETETIPLSLLEQPQPPDYRLAPGDVLGIHVDGPLGARAQPVPLHVGPLVQNRDQERLPPASGFPREVQRDGTIQLPFLKPISVYGLTLAEAAARIRDGYVKKDLLKPDLDRALVSLLQARRYQVIVMRQESPNFAIGPTGVSGSSKRGTGHIIDLVAYQNDVLHALAATGGLPGLDAYNEVIIFRKCFANSIEGKVVIRELQGSPNARRQALMAKWGDRAVRIPLRCPRGAPPPIHPRDVILETGDIVFLEARVEEVFYTAGLLPPGAHVLPRDYDLDVVEAIAQVRGALVNGAFGGSNLSGTLISPGIGNPSPSSLVVIRRGPNGGQVGIAVDLTRALRDPQSRERILVRSGDLLILQEKPEESLTRYFTQTFFNVNVAWEAITGQSISGVIDVSTPDRLNDRLPTVNINRR